MYKPLMLATLLATLPLVANAQPKTTPPTLAEAWLAWQEARLTQGKAPFDWAYSFALRSRDAVTLEPRQARLSAEMRAVASVISTYRDTDTARALGRWAEVLNEQPIRHARSPGPMGLPELAGDLRRNPSMADITQLGTCTPPSWVETWTLEGVGRLTWQPGMSLSRVLNALPPTAIRGIDHVMVITPTGDQQRRGIAAWNLEPSPLAPGARVIVQLPERGLGGTREGHLINRELSAWLATRLPGDDCTRWETP
ncbi:capsule biosynthesis GfcC family protein [Halomonas sp.]|uniref:capsule biosynthesis GfcC family protein n=1 Tax=Halomonas sp. TaxID=1486246 RepID=UPI00298E8188|nr:capsule biosynthesis GfcC family protein [Halomonas sp.]MDW7749071.1 capsule biosynthesis GfcC family protein [Halomonas sp.]